jgi:hypothetical protein
MMDYPHNPNGRRYRATFTRVRDHVVGHYGIPVLLSDRLRCCTGCLTGAEITLRRGLDIDILLFLMAHLFGHTVQWNVSPERRAVGMRGDSLEIPREEENMQAIRTYETEACQYALALYHEVGISDLDGWLADWSQADWSYLQEAYRQGRCPSDYRAFFRPGAGHVAPKLIPAFVPRVWKTAYAF